MKKAPFFIFILITLIYSSSYYSCNNPTNSVPLAIKQEVINVSYFNRIDPQSDLTPYLQDLCKKIKTKEIDGEIPLEDSLFTINLFRKYRNPPKYRLEISAYKETSDLPPFLGNILQDFYLVGFKYINTKDNDDYFTLEQPLSQALAYEILTKGLSLDHTDNQTSYLDKKSSAWTVLSNVQKFGQNKYNENGHVLDTSATILKYKISSGLSVLINFSSKNQPQELPLKFINLNGKVKSSRIIVDGVPVYPQNPEDLTPSSEYVTFLKPRNSHLPESYALDPSLLNLGQLPILKTKSTQ